MKPFSLHFFAAVLFAGMTLSGLGGEVLLHDGPTVSTPIGSIGSKEKVAEVVVFLKRFYIDSDELPKLPDARPLSMNEPAPIGAVRAIELANQSVFLGDKMRSCNVRRLELLVSTTLPKQIEYYLIEIETNGSIVHRIVLMNGAVIKSRLEKPGR